MAYCCTGSQRRWSTSTCSSNGALRAWSTSGTAAVWRVQPASRPARSRSRAQRTDSPPTTTATSEDPESKAVIASLMRLCCGMPSSTRWVGARGAHPVGDQTGRVGVGPGPLRDGDPVDGTRHAGRPAVGERSLHGTGHELDRLGIGIGHPDSDEDRDPRSGVPDGHPVPPFRSVPPAAGAGSAARRARSMRPSSRQDTGTAPRARAVDRARSGRS